MNVTSARIDLKIACAHAERLLERYAEPLTALHGTAWPERPLELAWRRIVDNSAHDSICGCSHDAVVAQVLTRYAEAEQIGRGVLGRTLDAIAGRVPRGQLGRGQSDPSAARGPRRIRRRGPARSGTRSSCGPAGAASRARKAAARIPSWPISSCTARRSRSCSGAAGTGASCSAARSTRSAIEPDHPDGTPLIRVFADDIADPPELDVEALLARGRDGGHWRDPTSRGASSSGPTSGAGSWRAWPMPALGWSHDRGASRAAAARARNRSRTRWSPRSDVSAMASCRSRSPTTARSG